MKDKQNIDKQIENLLARMTIEEKVAQMQQLSANATPKNEFGIFKAQGTIGSYLHVLGNETDEYLESAKKIKSKNSAYFRH